ncbi:hypothetical protein ACWD4X_32475, partial [Streptomyces termitum]
YEDTAGRLRESVRETAGQVKEEITTALEEARAGLAALTQELSAVRTAVDQLQPRPTTETAGAGEETPAAATAEHTRLLRTAARISSADLLCHRDTWEFLTALAAGHRHFRVPPRVTEEAHERVFAPLSGRSLIALLITLNDTALAAPDGSGDRELAAEVYERIEQRLTGIGPGAGSRVLITLDDRTPAAPESGTGDEDQVEQDGEDGEDGEDGTNDDPHGWAP